MRKVISFWLTDVKTGMTQEKYFYSYFIQDDGVSGHDGSGPSGSSPVIDLTEKSIASENKKDKVRAVSFKTNLLHSTYLE